MSKPLRSRPISLYLEDDSGLHECATIEEKHSWLPSTEQVTVTLYSCVRSLRGLLIGPTVW
jgi:hypothetical protein